MKRSLDFRDIGAQKKESIEGVQSIEAGIDQLFRFALYESTPLWIDKIEKFKFVVDVGLAELGVITKKTCCKYLKRFGKNRF